MDYVISYEVMSIVILALILVSYTCHKWLDIKRNRTFNLLVIMTICTVIVDLIGRSCVYVVGSNALFMATVVATVVNLSLYQVCLLFYKYTLNTLGCANVFYQGISAVFLVFDLLGDIALLSNPWTHFFFEYNGLHKGQYQIHYGMVVLLICAEILMLADAYFLYRYRHKIAKEQLLILTWTVPIIMVTMYFQYMTPMRWRLTYFILSLLVIVYYVTMHMSDQHLEQNIRCFSRIGFRKVVEEYERYQDNFACVSVNIRNLSSMMNMCSEQELSIVHNRIASYLQSTTKARGVYKFHNSEYVVVFKTYSKAWEAGRYLLQSMPKVLRINGQNIPVSYGLYMIQFIDAEYNAGDFYRIMEGLRHVILERSISEEVLCYEGDIKILLQRELSAVSRLNEMTNGDEFLIRFQPIYDTEAGEVAGLAIKVMLAMPDGVYLEESDIWRLAEKNGNGNRITLYCLERVIGFAVKHYIFEQGIRHLHISMTTMQISSQEMIEQYCDILLFHQIRPEQLVIEINVDQALPENILKENIQYLRDKGFVVLLDQFGMNVCNLKDMLALPFDMAKFHQNMTKRFMQDRQMELKHLVHMLRRQNWQIFLDGVDYSMPLGTFREMGVTGVQGESMTPYMQEDELIDWLRRRGGDVHYENDTL